MSLGGFRNLLTSITINYIKEILFHLLWVLLALVLGFSHMFLILGPKKETANGIMHFFDIIHDLALIHNGLIIGSIIAVIFTLINLIFLKQLQYYAFFIRLGMLIAIAAIVGVIHYSLEKIVDII